MAVVESWKQGIPPQWQPEDTVAGGVVVTQPQFVFMHEETERWIEITDKNGQLITVIEALSPSNKGADILQLQPLLDRCYRMGGYWNADPRNIPGPTLPEDEAAWTVAQVNAAGVGA